jgi:hypothetical protein
MEADYALEARRSSWRCAWQRVVRCMCCCFPLPLGSLSLRGGTAATGHPQPLLDEAGSGRRRAGGRTRGQHRSASARHHNRDDRCARRVEVWVRLQGGERSHGRRLFRKLKGHVSG